MRIPIGRWACVFAFAACGEPQPSDFATATASAGGGNPAGNLDQCANGPLSAPVPCTGGAWVNGNLNEQQAHYLEGEGLPYRLRMSDLEIGAGHTVRLEWDTTVVQAQQVHHALDYVLDYNYTETSADPCSGVTGCNPASVSTGSIWIDPRVQKGADGIAGTSDDITQIPGSFTLFGGTITDVSAYTYSGDFTGSSTASLTITFTASVSNPVLAWAGHITLRADWAPALTAVHIPGSPFHTAFLDLDGRGGNQDRSLSAAAVHTPPELIVIKHVINDNGGTAVAADFTMTVTATSPSPASFAGSETGTTVTVAPGSYSVGETGLSNYAATYSTDCTGTLDYDQTKTCTVTNDDTNLCLAVTCDGATDCLQAGVCNPATGQCEYQPKPADTLCRAAAGDCDVAEYCDGVIGTCPADGYAPATQECRASAGVCDVAELCTGTGPSCPSDLKSTAVCRDSLGICDVPESCDGASNDCPADGFLPATDVCRGSAGICDVPEACTGASAFCPADAFLPSTDVCRSSAGVCDVAETCTGASAGCPDDAFLPATEVCRGSAGVCDVAETCTGASASCPGDSFLASTQICRASAGVCDVSESCTGSGAACPDDGFLPATEVCRGSAGICDVAESCTGSSAACPSDGFVSEGIECRGAAGACDVAEVCTGAGASCPSDVFKPTTEVCRAAAGECDVAESCTSLTAYCPDDGYLPATEVCRVAAGECDVAETCTGTNGLCPSDVFKPNTDTCRESAGDCDVAEQCTGLGASCPSDAFASGTECRAAAGDCDVAETCLGLSASCPSDSFLPDSTVCREAAGICDVAESCTGSAALCPDDAFAQAGTLCRAVAGECDVAEECLGTSATCPGDGFLAAGTSCRASADACDPAEECTGAGASCPTDVFATCSLCGNKYYDANVNAVYDPEELGIAGWLFTLAGGTTLNATTASGGGFTFTGLAEGDYTLCETLPNESNWMQTAPAEVCYAVHVPSTEAELCMLDFGNACLGTGGGHTIGFWSNRNGMKAFLGADSGAAELALLASLNLYDAKGAPFDPTSYAQFKAWLNNADATSMAYMLSAQLAAMSLNVYMGWVEPDAPVFAPGALSANDLGFATVQALLDEANAELGLHNATFAGSPYRAYQEALKNGLDKANKNIGFLQPAACTATFGTTSPVSKKGLNRI